MVHSTTRNKRPLPGKFSWARANPASEQEMRVPTVVRLAMTKPFQRYSAIWYCSQMSR